jgi:hypothetical protein
LRRTIDSSPTRPVLCVSTWELDDEQPRLYAPIGNRWLHYRRLDSTAWKLRLLLAQHRTHGVMDALQSGAMAVAADEGAPEAAASGPMSAGPRAAWWRVTP